MNSRFVSVIIPAKNEGKNLNFCLASLEDQSYGKSAYEVLVVDNQSTDNTVSVASSFANVRVLECDANTIGGVRNFGVENTSGEIIAFVDADCICKTKFLETGIKLLESDNSLGAVGGDAVLPDEPSFVERNWVLPLKHESLYRSSLNGSSMIFFRKSFEYVGGFNADINANEDDLFASALLETRLRILWHPDLDVQHLEYPKTFKSFFLRQFWLGSSMFSSKKGVFDKVFIGSLMMICGLILGAYYFVTDKMYLIYLSLFFLLAPPCLFTAKKKFRSNAKLTFKSYLFIFIVSFIYFSGRALGLLFSISRKKYSRNK